MSYYGYCNFNSIEELVLDDLRVRKNRKQVYQFGKLIVLKSNRKTRRLIQKLGVVGNKVKTKGKRVSAYLVLSYTLSSPAYIIVSAASQNVLPVLNHGVSIHKLRQRIEEINEINHKKSLSQIAILKELKFDKIVLTDLQVKHADLIINQLLDGSLSSEEAILRIRGGSRKNMFFMGVGLYIIYCVSSGYDIVPSELQTFMDQLTAQLKAKGFTPKIIESNSRGRNSGNLGQTQGQGRLAAPAPPGQGRFPSRGRTDINQLIKPSSMSQQDYNVMPKLEKSFLPDEQGRDRQFVQPNEEAITFGFRRLWFKFYHHESGGVQSNPSISTDSSTNLVKPEKNEANVVRTRDFLLDQASVSKRYNDSTYYSSNTPPVDGTSFFNPDTNLLIFCARQPNDEQKVSTYVTLTPKERQHFLATDGKFATNYMLTQSGWVSPNPNWMHFQEQEEDNTSNPTQPLPSGSVNLASSPSSVNPPNAELGYTQVTGSFATDIEGTTQTNSHTSNDSININPNTDNS